MHGALLEERGDDDRWTEGMMDTCIALCYSCIDRDRCTVNSHGAAEVVTGLVGWLHSIDELLFLLPQVNSGMDAWMDRLMDGWMASHCLEQGREQSVHPHDDWRRALASRLPLPWSSSEMASDETS